ncbi:MAG: hypothetical protein MJ057_07100 [Sphaerochaetaceae bacterium]|nr:hypothetical protein [Sphaerochaetaceae bacterium]
MKRQIILTYLSALKKSFSATSRKISAKETIHGSLRISKRKGHIAYYHRQNGYDTTGLYLSTQDFNFIKQIAQQDYEKKVQISSEKSNVAITRCIEALERCTFPDEIYDCLPPERKALVTPIDSDDEYAKAWLRRHTYSEGYFKKDMPFYVTENGERVRSKTEHMMADRFKAKGIIYVFEPEVKTKDRTRRPDFLVLNKRTRKEYYIEHLGMMDDPAYVSENMDKLAEYENVGIILGKNLLLTFSNERHPMDSKKIDTLIENFLL